MPAKPFVIHVISNTHWDREWLYNFQETRMLLVAFFDGLLEILDRRPEYRAYVLDSQTVPVEDYLEVRPEQRDRIVRHVRDGRLLIGPWYTCPEGFEVNGESLVRNLLYGHRVARAFGGVMKVGHTPFSYGQNSQMPQIYAGFGIDTILFYHGVSHDEVKNEWILEGADGTRLLASQMSSGARYNFYHGVYRPVRWGKEAAEREYGWNECGMQFHPGGPDFAMDHHLILDPQPGLDLAKLTDRVRALRENEIRVATTRHLAFMMGHDSSIADEAEIAMIEAARAALPDDEVRHASYPEMMAAIKAEVDWDKLSVLRGERRTPKPMPIALHLYSDVLSSRARMKRRNAIAEMWLQRRAEPFAAAAAMLGCEYPAGLLDIAWKTLLKCHAHDSISGSGVDDIEEDMMDRLRQVINLSKGILKQALGRIQLRIDNGAHGRDAVLITVFNPTPQRRTAVVTTVVDLPDAGPRGEFRLVDVETGEATVVQDAGRRPYWAVVKHLGDAAAMVKSRRFCIHFEARNVPGLGYAVYKVDRSGMFDRGSLVMAANTLENAHLRAKVENDGTITLLHKATGVTYRDLGYVLDNGEAGHAWMHHNPAHDAVIDSRGFPASIEMEEDGPLLARLRVHHVMRVPARLEENGGDAWQRLDGVGNNARRSEETRPMPVSVYVTLRRDAPGLELRVCFHNSAEDHRIRMVFPTRRAGTLCHAESAFDVVARETVFGPESPWHGARGVTFPMQRFVDVSDGAAGLAIINDGLREYEVTQDQDRAIAVTLMRAYQVSLTTVSHRWEERPEMKLAQCPGAHEFRLLVYPHAGDYATGGVLAAAERFAAPMEPAQAGAHGGDLPPRHGFLHIEPDAIALSAFKRAENGDGYIVRLWNPTEETVEGTLRFGRPLQSAECVSLEEISLEPASTRGNVVALRIGPKKIMTVRVRFEQPQG